MSKRINELLALEAAKVIKHVGDPEFDEVPSEEWLKGYKSGFVDGMVQAKLRSPVAEMRKRLEQKYLFGG
jgi:hypothetical protein